MLAGLTRAQVNATGPLPVDGIDQWAAITHAAPSPRTELVHNINSLGNEGAIRVGKWKLLKGYPSCVCYNANDVRRLQPLVFFSCSFSLTPTFYSISLWLSRILSVWIWTRPRLFILFEPPLQGWWAPPEMGAKYEPSPIARPCEAHPCLFDLDADPEERTDLALSEPAVLQQLLERYAEMERSEVSKVAAGLCVDVPDGCVANQERGVWQPWVD
jgi:hypothetical protein